MYLLLYNLIIFRSEKSLFFFLIVSKGSKRETGWWIVYEVIRSQSNLQKLT